MDDCGCPCMQCREAEYDSESADHCNHCWRVAECCEALGHAIRRFVRRAEVERLRGLVERQCELASRHTALGAEWGDEADAALDRLAAMAMEGEQ